MIYMVLCKYCRVNVKPKSYLSWKGFLQGLGLFYLIYFISKLPHCPNCNFPMPRSRLIFAILPSQDSINMAKRNILQLFHFQAKRISFIRRPSLGLKLDASRHYFQWLMIFNENRPPRSCKSRTKPERTKAKR
jgi:hypothetical protein